MTAQGPHRTQGERDERPDAQPLHVGPRETCPACGAQDSTYCEKCQTGTPCRRGAPAGRCSTCKYHPKRELRVRVATPLYCSPAGRLRLSRWAFWRRCMLLGEHLHQNCTRCGAAWICAGVEPVTITPWAQEKIWT